MKRLILVGPLAAGLVFGFSAQPGDERAQQAQAQVERARAEAQEEVEIAAAKAEASLEQAREEAQAAAERTREAAERARDRAGQERERAESLRERAEAAYERASDALEERRWDEAIRSFSEVPRASTRFDAAQYWTAYAQYKAGRAADALARLGELEKDFPQSRWLNDARALAIEVRQAQGRPPQPEAQDDEDLKLMAINSLMHSNAERAVPMLEQVLNSSASPRLKERALFVLAQSGSPQARQTIINYAKGSGNPEIQSKAINYLGLFGGADSGAALAEIYRTSQDVAVRKQVINAWFLKGDAARITELAKTEKNPELRREAITRLGMMGKRTAGELRSLYSSEPDKQLKKAVLNAFFVQGNAQALIQIARTETDPELKRAAVSKLSVMDSKEAADYMMEVLQK